MRTIIICIIVIVLGVVLLRRGLYSYESAFKKTPVDKIEIKTIPASKLLVTEKSAGYYDVSNELFRRLFSYISDNSITMTVPVEAEIKNAQMKFYIGSKDREKDLSDRRNVRVETAAQRMVASIGIRGAYTKSNFDKAQVKIEEWVQSETEYRKTGDAYAVFWDGPFIPWFLKRSEVHVPVEKAKDTRE